MSINFELLESEHVIGRLKLVELMERRNPYRHSADGIERRFAQALSRLPTEHHQGALAIFGSTLYLTQKILDDGWKHLWREIKELWPGICATNAVPDLSDLAILELDRDQLRDDFYRANNLEGRLQDNLPWRSTHDIVDELSRMGSAVGSSTEKFSAFLSRRRWIVLADLSLSGTSLVSEVVRLRKVLTGLGQSTAEIIALVQVMTSDAAALLSTNGIAFKNAVMVPGAAALSKKEYSLIVNSDLILAMRRLCQWFADEIVMKCDSRLTQQSGERGRETAVYGFGEAGWSVVTHRNTPNNSLPILWFDSSSEYRPPFPRNESRVGEIWSGRNDWVKEFAENDTLRSGLRRVLKLQPAGEV